jgi:hypothetical protein
MQAFYLKKRSEIMFKKILPGNKMYKRICPCCQSEILPGSPHLKCCDFYCDCYEIKLLEDMGDYLADSALDAEKEGYYENE